MNKKLIAIAVATVMAAPVMAADMKISGRLNQQFISHDIDGGASTLNNTDNGHQRLQFDVKAGNAFGRVAYDARQGKGGTDRDSYVGYKFSGASVQYGRMANAAKNIEKDPLIATFLESRSSAANAASVLGSGKGSAYSSNGFISEIVEVKLKAGGATIKVQAGFSDNDKATAAVAGDANQGHIGVSVTGKAGGVRWWIANNNGEADGADATVGATIGTASDQSSTKIGASMKFGKVATTLDYQTTEVDSFETTSTTIRANMSLGGGAKVYAGISLREDDSAGSAGDATWLRLAYSKKLSGGAMVYAGYTSTDYDTAGPADTSTLGVGMTIKF